jgi:hypothetical protein
MGYETWTELGFEVGLGRGSLVARSELGEDITASS